MLYAKNGKAKHEYIHRLVAIAFLDNPDNLPQVNHKDENKANNCVENLEWCSVKYNINYGTRNQHNRETRGMKLEVWKNNELIGMFNGTYEAAKALGVSQNNVWRWAKGGAKSR